MTDIDTIKQKIVLSELFRRYGFDVGAERNGKFKTRCRWHDDSDPSLEIDDAMGSYRCWVCMQRNEDAFDFVQRVEGIEFYDALKILADVAGVELPERKRMDETDRRRAEAVSNIVSGAALVRDAAVSVWHRRLMADPAALSGLVDGRRRSLDTIQSHRIGWAGGMSREDYPEFGKSVKAEIESRGMRVPGRSAWVCSGAFQPDTWDSDPDHPKDRRDPGNVPLIPEIRDGYTIPQYSRTGTAYTIRIKGAKSSKYETISECGVKALPEDRAWTKVLRDHDGRSPRERWLNDADIGSDRCLVVEGEHDVFSLLEAQGAEKLGSAREYGVFGFSGNPSAAMVEKFTAKRARKKTWLLFDADAAGIDYVLRLGPAMIDAGAQALDIQCLDWHALERTTMRQVKDVDELISSVSGDDRRRMLRLVLDACVPYPQWLARLAVDADETFRRIERLKARA